MCDVFQCLRLQMPASSLSSTLPFPFLHNEFTSFFYYFLIQYIHKFLLGDKTQKVNEELHFCPYIWGQNIWLVRRSCISASVCILSYRISCILAWLNTFLNPLSVAQNSAKISSWVWCHSSDGAEERVQKQHQLQLPCSQLAGVSCTQKTSLWGTQ